MKQILSILLVAAMLLALVGCSGKPPAGTVTQGEAPKAATTQTDPEVTVSLGRMDGGVYENSYAHIGCALDESWSYYTAEEIQDVEGFTQEALQDSDLGKFNQVTDMMAENAESLCSINIIYTRLSLQDRLAFSISTEEDIVDATLTQADTMAQAYANAGIENAQFEKVRFQFLGKEHVGIHTSATIEDVPYYITQAFLYNLGGPYYVTVTMASFLEDNSASMLDLFYPLS